MGKSPVTKSTLRPGDVVLVTFPFSNLKGQKIRPALVLANVEFDNVILCQITSKPYSSKIAIRLEDKNFAEGKLPVTSFVRPDKLFTADKTIIRSHAGYLKSNCKTTVLQSVRKLFTS
jgi:mRNA interferase MazF